MLRRVRQSLRQVLVLMARRPGLVCGAIVLSVLLILAVMFTCSRAKNVVAAARPPVRFFSVEAPVVDLYLGQLDQVERLRGVAEVSLIFFYAPWCAHSMAARQEVQQVAKRLAKQVQFVAVNCWWSQGKCRKQNRLYEYPVIHLFYRRFGPIEYKGPFTAAYVESFVLRVITPLTYLPSQAMLQDFLSYHEPRVVGFFQFNSSPQPPGYITYLSTALQALKRDFRGVVRFGVVTNRQVAEAISVTEDETVYLHRRFNASLIFPRWERNFTSEGICSWVFDNRETVLHWLQPPGTKSHLLEQELTKGPALLLFLPHNPLGSTPSPTMMQIADIAVRYHSCFNPYHHYRLDSSGASLQCCQSVLLPQSSAGGVCELCIVLSRPDSVDPETRCSFPSVAREGTTFHSYLRSCCLHRPPPASMSSITAASVACSNFLSSYHSLFGLYSACCMRIQPQLNDTPSQVKEGLHSQAPPLAPPPSSSILPSSAPYQDGGAGVTGLRCRTNKTLRFYLLDVDLNWPLAMRLGAPSNRNASQHTERDKESSDWSFATIVNLKDEVHYVLHQDPATTLRESLEAFIWNFSAPYSPLQRHLVGQREEGKEEDVRPLITELTTTTFIPSVMELDKDVLLFYYTQWCGFCSALNHIIIQLARLFQGNSTVIIARVNVARNDLPWEFMVDHVPSILLFPRYRKHLSVKFPHDMPITLPNLLHFILKHSGSTHRHTDGATNASSEGSGEPGRSALLRAQFLALQDEVQALHLARERLSRQLAELWRDNRQLTLDTRALEAQNAALQRERQSLEEQHREKSRQLGEAVRRLQELADTSESLLNENMLLRVLLRALKDRTEAMGEEVEGKEGEQKRSHMAS